MNSPADNLRTHQSGLSRGLFSKEKAAEKSGVHYLAQCFARASAESMDSKVQQTRFERYKLLNFNLRSNVGLNGGFHGNKEVPYFNFATQIKQQSSY